MSLDRPLVLLYIEVGTNLLSLHLPLLYRLYSASRLAIYARSSLNQVLVTLVGPYQSGRSTSPVFGRVWFYPHTVYMLFQV